MLLLLLLLKLRWRFTTRFRLETKRMILFARQPPMVRRTCQLQKKKRPLQRLRQQRQQPLLSLKSLSQPFTSGPCFATSRTSSVVSSPWVLLPLFPAAHWVILGPVWLLPPRLSR
jgi:hypothetical protein